MAKLMKPTVVCLDAAMRRALECERWRDAALWRCDLDEPLGTAWQALADAYGGDGTLRFGHPADAWLAARWVRQRIDALEEERALTTDPRLAARLRADIAALDALHRALLTAGRARPPSRAA